MYTHAQSSSTLAQNDASCAADIDSGLDSQFGRTARFSQPANSRSLFLQRPHQLQSWAGEMHRSHATRTLSHCTLHCMQYFFQESLEFRMHLRHEILQLGIFPVANRLRALNITHLNKCVFIVCGMSIQL